jgi:oligopeptide transport system substrate-binding protein
MRTPRRLAWLALPAALALVVSGCSGGGGGSETSDEGITIDGTEPQNPLIPCNTNEVGGGQVLSALSTGLVAYKTKDAEPYNAQAESIEPSQGGKVYTIKLKKGWKFHDGTEVKAHNYVDAWNYCAYGPNGQLNASFMQQIQGFDDVYTEDPDEDGPAKAPKPKAEKMSGLKVVDDYTIEVTLKEPFGVFPTKIGYTAFYALPDSFFKDPKAYESKPIGNGPFKFVSRQANSEIKLTRNDDYKGPDKAHIKDVTIKIYNNQDTAYADLQSGNLDFMQQMPTSTLAGDRWKKELGDKAIERPVLVIQTLSFPLYKKEFQSADLRKGISLAINREEITEKIFQKTRQPADSWNSPAVDGQEGGTCGEWCDFDPAKAKELITKSGFKGPLTLSYNADGDHKPWTEAVCNSIQVNTGIQCKAVPVVDFATFRTQVTSAKMTGMFRTGWQYDYPAIENGLNPLYRTGASSNDGKYTNKAFDDKLAEADRETDPDKANKLYVEAEKMLEKDMPVLPLWYVKQQSGHSDRVTNVQVSAFGEPDLSAIEVA